MHEEDSKARDDELLYLHSWIKTKVSWYFKECIWCERCLLITESPKTPGHYRYLIWVLENVYHHTNMYTQLLTDSQSLRYSVTQTHTHTRKLTKTHTPAHTLTHTHTHTHTHAHTHTHTRTQIQTHTRTPTHAQRHSRIRTTPMDTQTYAHEYKRTHTHTM